MLPPCSAAYSSFAILTASLNLLSALLGRPLSGFEDGSGGLSQPSPFSHVEACLINLLEAFEELLFNSGLNTIAQITKHGVLLIMEQEKLQQLSYQVQQVSLGMVNTSSIGQPLLLLILNQEPNINLIQESRRMLIMVVE